MGKALLSVLLFATALYAADDGPAILRPPAKPSELFAKAAPVTGGMHLWRVSVVALAAANCMDVQSSWGKRELNPALAGSRGEFGARGALLKAGITGGVVALEYLFLRVGRPRKLTRGLAIVNFGNAALVGSVAVRNWRLPTP
jgi:hypothetical protein